MYTLMERFDYNHTPEVFYYRDVDWLKGACERIVSDLNIPIYPRYLSNTYNLCENIFPNVRYETFRFMGLMDEYRHVNCGFTKSTDLEYLNKFMVCHHPTFIVGENLTDFFKNFHQSLFRRLKLVAIFEHEPDETREVLSIRFPDCRVETIELKLSLTGDLICGVK